MQQHALASVKALNLKVKWEQAAGFNEPFHTNSLN